MTETKEKTPDRNVQAREDFKRKMMMQQMMGGGMPPQKPLTPEEIKAQKTQHKEYLQKTLKDKDASLNVMEKYIARVIANKDLLINVDLEKAETEWHKKATQAEIEELQAIIEEQNLQLGTEKESKERMETELKELKETEESTN